MKDDHAVFEMECRELMQYLYGVATQRYSDCPELESIIQDTMLAYVIKRNKGEEVEHPKAFLSAVLKNQYNRYLRRKYQSQRYTVEFNEALGMEYEDETSDAEEKQIEYEAVRREIGRLIRIYREVTVRYYVHGQCVERIADELNIPRGTVLSRLNTARSQIKEGITNMERYAKISYEPKRVSIGIWGSTGMNGEPLSLIHSDIEAGVLILAYEDPISPRSIADSMGMPSAYLEQIISQLVKNELVGMTDGGLVYTRCYMQKYEDSFGNIEAQEALADQYPADVWKIVRKHIAPLIEGEEFAAMSEKQKATLILFVLNQTIGHVVQKCRPDNGNDPKKLPERPNGGCWLAKGTIFENGQEPLNKYSGSGPVIVNYGKNNDGNFDCKLFDCQSVFGDAHWAYSTFKYQLPLQTIMRFYASLMPCDVTPDNHLVCELVPDFERLGIVKRDESGEIRLDIPALSYDEAKLWDPVTVDIQNDLYDLIGKDITALWRKTKNKVPKHVDCREYFIHAGALGAYTKAQMLSIVNKELMPYQVQVGKTPIIYLSYRKKQENI